MSDLLHLLPLLRIPLQANVDVPGSSSSARISSDNILHDLTISYQGDKYNVLMEDVASIINIPQTLRNVKVFNHQGTKHFRIMKHRGGDNEVKKAKKTRPNKGKGVKNAKKPRPNKAKGVKKSKKPRPNKGKGVKNAKKLRPNKGNKETNT